MHSSGHLKTIASLQMSAADETLDARFFTALHELLRSHTMSGDDYARVEALCQFFRLLVERIERKKFVSFVDFLVTIEPRLLAKSSGKQASCARRIASVVA